MSSYKHIGKLYLIPTTLGDTPTTQVLPIIVDQIIEGIDNYIVENEKSARRFIKKVKPQKSQSVLKLHPLNKHTVPQDLFDFLTACKEGKDIGLLSEAGVPGIADPGAEIVKLAHEQGIQVVPLVGPSSILLAMMASGLNGQNFAFNGYLPIDNKERKNEIKRLERLCMDYGQAQSFIETPYRNNKMLEVLCATCNDNTLLCIACDLTLPSEYILTQPIAVWKRTKVDLHKRPAIFILGK